MFALGQPFFKSFRVPPAPPKACHLSYRAQVEKNDKKRPGGFRFVEGEIQWVDLRGHLSFHFLLYFLEAAEVSFGLFLEFAELGIGWVRVSSCLVRQVFGWLFRIL